MKPETREYVCNVPAKVAYPYAIKPERACLIDSMKFDKEGLHIVAWSVDNMPNARRIPADGTLCVLIANPTLNGAIHAKLSIVFIPEE